MFDDVTSPSTMYTMTGDNINIWLLTLMPAVVGIIACSKKILLDR